MPLDEKGKTAYHEAGHCFRGWRANFFAVNDTCLFEEPAGEWWGNTPMRRSGFTRPQRTAIALAGLLAEAKAVATDDGPVRHVVNGPGLAASIAQLYAAHVIPVAGPGVEIQDDDVWPIHVPIQGGDPVEAYVTLSDLAEVPDDYRTLERIGEAIDDLVSFLNSGINWEAIKAIANNLILTTSGCLGHFHIYCIIREATDPFPLCQHD